MWFFKKKNDGASPNNMSNNSRFDINDYQVKNPVCTKEEMQSLYRVMKKFYDEHDGYIRTQISGKNISIRLIHPGKIMEFLKEDYWKTKDKYFGIGGNEYVSPSFLKYRVKLRLSAFIYNSSLHCFTEEMYEYLESLTGMECSDAVHYYRLTKYARY